MLFAVTCSIGDVKWPFWAGLIAHWCIGLPLAYWLGEVQGGGIGGVWQGPWRLDLRLGLREFFDLVAEQEAHRGAQSDAQPVGTGPLMPTRKDLAVEFYRHTLALEGALKTMDLPDALSGWSSRDLAGLLTYGLFCVRWQNPKASESLQDHLTGSKVLRNLRTWIQSQGADRPISRTVQAIEDSLRAASLSETLSAPMLCPQSIFTQTRCQAVGRQTAHDPRRLLHPVEVVDCMI